MLVVGLGPGLVPGLEGPVGVGRRSLRVWDDFFLGRSLIHWSCVAVR